jgi:branched-chain amino acid transport system ATP-binding protein
MANIKNNALNKRINHRIEQLKYKMRYRTQYADVIQEKMDDNQHKELKKLEQVHRRKLYPLELETLTKDAFHEIFIKPELSKLDQKLVMKQKAILQSYKRGLSKHSDQKESLEAKFKEKNELAEQNIKTKKEELNEIDAKRDKSKSGLEITLKSYQAAKSKLNQAYEEKKQELISKTNKEVNQYKAKTEIENKKLTMKINALLKQKADLNITDEQYDLKDDVILSLKGLTMKFGGLVAVDQLSFDVKAGEVFGLIGPNGAGKTTVFNCITQFYKASAGQIIYRNRSLDVVSLNDYKVHNVIKEGIVRTFQNVELIWELSILDNLLVAAHTLYHSNFFHHLVHTRLYKREEEIIRLRAIKILTDLDLILYKDFYPLGLPYGILKLVELARTLMTHPKLIILDEPAAGLNDIETAKLIKTIRKIQKDYQCTIFLVEHDMGLVMEICDTICAISFGKMLAIGTPKQIQSNKLVQEAYLGGE